MKYALLHVEELPGEQMNLKVIKPGDCARMIRQAMETRPDLGPIFVSAVADWWYSQGFPFADMEKLARDAADKYK